MLPLFKHQKQSIKFLSTKPEVFDMSDPGCVSADTEFLTPTGWKRIDKYTEGDQVAQFYPDSREIEFVNPVAYIKRPCATMIAIAPTRGMSQRLSHEHRVLYYHPDGTHNTIPAIEYASQLHKRGPAHFKAKFSSTYTVRNNTKLDLSDVKIRIMVAVIADGHFATESSTRCVVRLKKDRKVKRLRELLLLARIDFDVRQCGGQPEFTVFTFNAPRIEKEFTAYWWQANQAQLEIIADEVCHWDSSEDKRKSNGTRFSTTIEQSAEFIQYAFAAAKRPTSIKLSVRDRRSEDRGIMWEYTVHAQDTDKFIGPGRASSVYEVANPEGYKYCFEVPTSYLLLRHNGYIFATGNTGKTRVEIEDIAAQAKLKDSCSLIIAPKSLLKCAWFDDFKKFAPSVKCIVATAANRASAFSEAADVYITNHDAVAWLVKQPPSFFKRFKNGTIVVDESSAFKHKDAQRSKALIKISKYFKRKRAMSGTPNSNGICDIWNQVFFLDGGKRLGTSFFQFRASVCTPEQVGPMANMVKWVDKPHAEAAVSALIQDIVIRHKFEDCVDIPANHQYSVNYELGPKHMAAYKRLEADSILLMNESVINAVNGATLYTKLLQLSSGAVYNEEGAYTLIDSDRYETVLDLVEARQHTIVFFNWAHQRDELIKHADKRGLNFALIDGTVTRAGERERIVEAYQKGLYDVLFAHPQSAGHGLTLTRGTATIWASPTYNLEHYQQGLKRVHRIGQTEKTETIMLVAPGTIEEQVYESLMNKNTRMTNLLEFLKQKKAA